MKFDVLYISFLFYCFLVCVCVLCVCVCACVCVCINVFKLFHLLGGGQLNLLVAAGGTVNLPT